MYCKPHLLQPSKNVTMAWKRLKIKTFLVKQSKTLCRMIDCYSVTCCCEKTERHSWNCFSPFLAGLSYNGDRAARLQRFHGWVRPNIHCGAGKVLVAIADVEPLFCKECRCEADLCVGQGWMNTSSEVAVAGKNVRFRPEAVFSTKNKPQKLSKMLNKFANRLYCKSSSECEDVASFVDPDSRRWDVRVFKRKTTREVENILCVLERQTRTENFSKYSTVLQDHAFQMNVICSIRRLLETSSSRSLSFRSRKQKEATLTCVRWLPERC